MILSAKNLTAFLVIALLCALLGPASASAQVVQANQPETPKAGVNSSPILMGSGGEGSWRVAFDLSGSSDTFWGITVDPSDPQILYTGTNLSGVWKSTDGGVTWTQTSTGLTDLCIFQVAVSPSDPQVLYAASNTQGVFKSIDGGANWTKTGTLTAMADVERSYNNVWRVAVDPTTPSTVYAAAIPYLVYTSSHAGRVFKSTDGGANWVPTSLSLDNDYVLSLIIDPKDPSTLYAGTSGHSVEKSSDGGVNWTQTNTLMNRSGVWALAIDPKDSSTLYAGTWEGYWIFGVYGENLGVFKTTNGGADWTATNSGLTYLGILSIAIDPTNSQILHLSTDETGGSDCGSFQSTDGGANWTLTANGLVTRGDHTVFGVAVKPADPNAPQTLFAATDGKIFKWVPSIGLISPIGGEKWGIDTPHLIQYTCNGIEGPVTIELSRDLGTSWTPLKSSTETSTSGSFSFPWTPTNPGTINAKIRVSGDGVTATSSVFEIAEEKSIPSGTFTATFAGGQVQIEGDSSTSGALWVTPLENPLTKDPDISHFLAITGKQGAVFWDIGQLNLTGTLTITIHYAPAPGEETFRFFLWNGSTWVPQPGILDTTHHTFIFTIDASLLTGTPFALAGDPAAMPSMAPWGIALLTGGLLAAGAFFFRKRPLKIN